MSRGAPWTAAADGLAAYRRMIPSLKSTVGSWRHCRFGGGRRAGFGRHGIGKGSGVHHFCACRPRWNSPGGGFAQRPALKKPFGRGTTGV